MISISFFAEVNICPVLQQYMIWCDMFIIFQYIELHWYICVICDYTLSPNKNNQPSSFPLLMSDPYFSSSLCSNTLRQPPVFNPVTQVVFHSRVKVTACGKTPMFTCFQSKGFPQSSMLQCCISVYHSTIETSRILKTKTVSFECCQIIKSLSVTQ